MKKNIFITESQYKYIINEGITDIVYHFTTLRTLHFIAKDSKLYFSNSLSNTVDFSISQYPYYLSVTRSFSSKIGYPKYKNETASQFSRGLNVRIELNGRLLGSMYKGKPVNYHWLENDDVPQQKRMKNNYQGNDWEKDKQMLFLQIRQDEDRILSEEPYINLKNSKGETNDIIKRVDVTLGLDGLGKPQLKTCYRYLYFIFNSPIGDRVFVYKNETDFNNRNHRDSLEFHNKIKEYLLKNPFNGDEEDINRESVSDSKIKDMGAFIRAIMLCNPNQNIENIINGLIRELKINKFEFDEYKIREGLQYWYNNINSDLLRTTLNNLKNNFIAQWKPIYSYLSHIFSINAVNYYKNNEKNINAFLDAKKERQLKTNPTSNRNFGLNDQKLIEYLCSVNNIKKNNINK